MKIKPPRTQTLAVLALLTLPVSLVQAAAPQSTSASAQAAAGWTQANLQSGTYVVLPPTIEGNVNLLGADQKQMVVTALQHDLQGAIQRKYPNAKFVTDPATPGVITLRPSATMPGALVPWESFQVRVDLKRAQNSAVLQDRFGVWDVYTHRADAFNYIYDKLVAKLP